MKKGFKSIILSLAIIFLMIMITTCNTTSENGEPNGNGNGNENGTYDVDTLGIPQFVTENYLNLTKIYRISKFRSSVGHSYSDDFESCRSMKHYFQPRTSINWASVEIYSPVNGTIQALNDGWAGTQVHVKSTEFPAFIFILFHVNLSGSFTIGQAVSAGQQLGTHIGSQTMSDIAIGVSTPTGWKYISYFDTMTNSLFTEYQARGINNRNTFIISLSSRDNDPLTCDGEDFLTYGSLANWVILN